MDQKTKRASRLALQPRPRKPRQLKRSREQSTLVRSATTLKPEEGGKQVLQAKTRQLRKARQLAAALPIVQRPEVPIAKVQYARRMAPRQLAANKLLTAALSEGVEDLIIGKVAQARVAQGRQNAALKSNKRVFAEKP